MKELSSKFLIYCYLAAILIVASLSILCHVALVREIDRNDRAAAVISLSGRQRMLSQRIAGMAAAYRLGVPGARESLIGSINVFDQNSRELLNQITAIPHDDPIRNTLLQLYLDGPQSAQASSQLFLSEARDVAMRSADNPDAIRLSNSLFDQARSPLLDQFEGIVDVQHKQSGSDIHSLERSQNIMLALILLTLFLEAALIFRPMVERITVFGANLVTVAATDPLTGLQNRRAFLQSGEAELIRARRYQRPLSLLMLDVDHFKAINDTHGHGAGDLVLQTLADTITQTLRSIDRSGRLGGEEFAILLPETSLAGATLVAERLRLIIAALEVDYAAAAIRVTVSIGVTQIASTIPTLTEALVFADRAMYLAKAQGRNRVVATNQAIPFAAR